MQLQDTLPELAQLEQLLMTAPAELKVEVLAQVPHMAQRLPLYALTLGNTAADKPAVLLVGGVHGLERRDADGAMHRAAPAPSVRQAVAAFEDGRQVDLTHDFHRIQL